MGTGDTGQMPQRRAKLLLDVPPVTADVSVVFHE